MRNSKDRKGRKRRRRKCNGTKMQVWGGRRKGQRLRRGGRKRELREGWSVWEVLAKSLAELESRRSGVMDQVNLSSIHQQAIHTPPETPVEAWWKLGWHIPQSTWGRGRGGEEEEKIGIGKWINYIWTRSLLPPTSSLHITLTFQNQFHQSHHSLQTHSSFVDALPPLYLTLYAHLTPSLPSQRLPSVCKEEAPRGTLPLTGLWLSTLRSARRHRLVTLTTCHDPLSAVACKEKHVEKVNRGIDRYLGNCLSTNTKVRMNSWVTLCCKCQNSWIP